MQEKVSRDYTRIANIYPKPGKRISTEPHFETMTFPRALELAEAVWSPTPRESYEDFTVRLRPHLARLEQLGVNYRKP